MESDILAQSACTFEQGETFEKVGPSPSEDQHHLTEEGVVACLDTVGAVVSLSCAVHCVLLPFLVTVFPLLGLSFFADERFEFLVIGIAIPIAFLTLCFGYRKHRRVTIPLLAVLGIGCFLAAHFLFEGEWQHALWVGGGGAFLGSAHIFNRILCRRCKQC